MNRYGNPVKGLLKTNHQREEALRVLNFWQIARPGRRFLIIKDEGDSLTVVLHWMGTDDGAGPSLASISSDARWHDAGAAYYQVEQIPA
ncbi:hypothetical protein [Chitinimonas sp.]|uniref:hypothetical protein n=1 Tax=Chitinimonas sp. TaxID=1934313 RepID=UPI0035B2A415